MMTHENEAENAAIPETIPTMTNIVPHQDQLTTAENEAENVLPQTRDTERTTLPLPHPHHNKTLLNSTPPSKHLLMP